MTEWTETEIDAEEYWTLRDDGHRKPVAYRLRRVIDHLTSPTEETVRYFRLDPPAPKYREGEMRWLTDSLGRRWLAFYVDGGWTTRPGGTPVWFDDTFTLSDPVVVVPAPTDEEREDFIGTFFDRDWATPGHRYANRLAAAFRDQEAS